MVTHENFCEHSDNMLIALCWFLERSVMIYDFLSLLILSVYVQWEDDIHWQICLFLVSPEVVV